MKRRAGLVVFPLAPEFALPDRLSAAARGLHLEPGQAVFRAGDAASAVYRVLAGEVHMLRRAPDGAEIVLQRARAGDFFAEASLFATHYHCDAVSVGASRCLCLPAESVRQCLGQDPEFALAWIASLSRSLRLQRAAQERLALKSTRARIVHYLVDRGDNGRVTLDQPLLRWATELGVSHEALYRTLAAMEKDGLLAREGATLALLEL